MRIIAVVLCLFAFQSFSYYQELYDLDWVDAKNKTHKLTGKDFKRKVTILKFFQSWCPGCHSYGLPLFKEISDHYEGSSKVNTFAVQTVFEGFSTNTKGKLSRTRKKYKLTSLMAQDDGGGKGSTLIRVTQARGTPWFVILNKKGDMVFSGYRLSLEKVKKIVQKFK